MVSEKNCSHGREHSRTKTCLRQKVSLEEYTKRAAHQGVTIHVSQHDNGNPNGQFSRKHQERVARSSNVVARTTVPLTVDADVIVLRCLASHSAHVLV